MKLRISHITTYDYDTPVHYALQQLRLTPRSGHGQTVLDWTCDISGARQELAFDDQFMNHTNLIKVDPGATQITNTCTGTVEVEDRSGIVWRHSGYALLWLFQRPTAMTAPGNQIRHIAATVREDTADMDDLARLHHLSGRIAQLVRYETRQTDGRQSGHHAGRGQPFGRTQQRAKRTQPGHF